jgi:hypothetical protein
VLFRLALRVSECFQGGIDDGVEQLRELVEGRF